MLPPKNTLSFSQGANQPRKNYEKQWTSQATHHSFRHTNKAKDRDSLNPMQTSTIQYIGYYVLPNNIQYTYGSAFTPKRLRHVIQTNLRASK